MTIHSLFIANRGEIACRIIRACRALGLRSIVAYSDADGHALSVRLADEAVNVGPASPRASYLDIERLVAAAKQAKADAVHPGYGFVSENADFAQAVIDAGLIFIGPPPAVTRVMGSKLAARAMAQRAGLAVAPGLAIPDGPFTAEPGLVDKISAIGFPLLIKASSGGGGRGMRRVDHAGDLNAAIDSARHEAASAFGDGRVYVEKLIGSPRHIEVQILADNQGGVMHLFERECSIQRRHQKLIEESPSPFVSVTPALRRTLCDAAVELARAAGYVNAGTIEFIVDPEGAAYFLEMNTRLQVEHAVTECVTDLDLVQAQIRLADGLPLGEVTRTATGGGVPAAPRTHAIECRICAEDAENGFLPSTGRITRLIEPRGARVEAGVASGDVVTPYYDSLLAKVITSGATRAEAIQAMERALAEFVIEGVTTNIAFLRDVIRHPAFARGETNTDFLAQHFAGWHDASLPYPGEDRATAARAPLGAEDGVRDSDPNPWHWRNRFRLGEAGSQRRPDRLALKVGDKPLRGAGIGSGRDLKDVAAPMPALVRDVLTRAGSDVRQGETLVILEAMKMEMRIVAPRDARVATVLCDIGQAVDRGQVLVAFA